MDIWSLVTVRDTLKFTAATEAGGPVFSPANFGEVARVIEAKRNWFSFLLLVVVSPESKP
jgi:hypothetical protein